MTKHHFEKLVFVLSAVVILSVSFFSFGVYSGQSKNFLSRLVNHVIADLRLVIQDLSHEADTHPIHFMQPSRLPGQGVTLNQSKDDSLILLSGFFDHSNALRLIKRDGTVVADWKVNFSELFPDQHELPLTPTSDWNIDLHGVHINPDGSVVVNLEYAAAVKLSKCGELQWTLPGGHHSMAKSERGGYWIPGRRLIGVDEGNQYPPLTYFPPSIPPDGEFAFEDDLVLKVSEDGVITAQKSVVEILYQNGLESLLTATGYNYDGGKLKKELVHLNKIAELPASYAPHFPQFEAHDLLLSLRQYNLLLVVDPDDWKIKWHKVGPWLRQHDPEFHSDGSIIVFNNNAYRNSLGELDRERPGTEKNTNILKVNPKTNQVTRLYGSVPGQELLSVIRGKVDINPEGTLLITEFEAGRVLEVDNGGNIVWEYINRYDDDFVLEITEGREYSKDYFTTTDWSCPKSPELAAKIHAQLLPKP